MMLGLVKNGVPFEIAEDLDGPELLAWTIIMGECEGGEWDWSRMEWKKKD